MRVLIVEDDISVCRANTSILRRTFTTAQLDVAYAHEAGAAIELLKASACDAPPFDLVMSDFQLRDGSNGGQVLDWIQEHLSYLASRFVFISSKTHLTQLRGVPFFDKPCDVDALRATLRSIINP